MGWRRRVAVVLLLWCGVVAGLTAFFPATDFTSSVTDTIVAMETFDCNKDGWVDVLALQDNGDVYLARNLKPGFAVTKIGSCAPLGGKGIQVSTYDVDGNGYLDVFCMEAATNLGGIYFFKSNGLSTCTYQTRTTIYGNGVAYKNPTMYQIADADKDGDNDVIFTTRDDSKIWYFKWGAGGWSSVFGPVTVTNPLSALLTVDWNSDNAADLLILEYAPTVTSTGHFRTSPNDGNTWSTAVNYGPLTAPWGARKVLINSDTSYDAIAYSATLSTNVSRCIYYMLSNSYNSWSQLTPKLPNVFWADAQKLSNDAYVDIIASSNNNLVMIEGTSTTPSFASTVTQLYSLSSSSRVRSFVVADFNLDGANDIFFGSDGAVKLGVTLQVKDYCIYDATLPNGLATLGNCTGTVARGSICRLGCAVGYYISAFAYGACTGSGWIPYWTGANVTCSAVSCPAIANNAPAGYLSRCATGSYAYQATCTLFCANAYSGTNVTRTCASFGSGAWDSAAVPSCTAVTCPAVPSSPLNNYVSGCTVAVAYATTCVLTCATGYAGAAAPRYCTQPAQGAVGAWNVSTTPTCTLTTCASIGAGTGFTTSCTAPTTTQVGATCTSFCVVGYQGSNVTHSCQQTMAGASASWASLVTASCTPTSCVGLPNGANYASSCTGGVTVTQSCQDTCSNGYVGANMTHVCQQTSVGAPANWDSSSTPTCTTATCAAISATSDYSSTCSGVLVGGSCIMKCVTGRVGASVALTCFQPVLGSAPTYNSSALPTCTPACLPVAGNNSAGYSSSCAYASTAPGDMCDLSCNAGYYGATERYLCQVGATWNSTKLPACVSYACPVIPGYGSYTSSCSGAQTAPSGTCTLTCATGYSGGSVTRNCKPDYTWDSTAPPSCTINTCSALTAATSYSSTCPVVTTNYGQTCTRACTSGYAGTSVVALCQATGNWDQPAAPTCAATTCGPLLSSTGVDTACGTGVNTNVGSTCTRSCSLGYVGSSITSTCVQTAVGATASWDLTTVPSCSITQCPPLSSTSSVATTCGGSASNVGSTCLLSCATGYTGSAVSRTCGQADSSSLAVWTTNSPTCIVATCAAVANGTNFTTSCTGGPVNYGGSCTLTCKAGFLVAPTTRTCTQASAGAVGGWSSTAAFDCGPKIICRPIPATAAYTSSCASGTSLVGDTCVLTCGPNYVWASVTHTCQPTSAWDSEAAPTCTLLSCPAVSLVPYPAGTLVGSCTGGVVGEVCSLSCDDSYRPSALALFTCGTTVNGVSAAYDNGHINCTLTPPVCGNGIIEGSEQCDLGTATMASPTSCCQNCNIMGSSTTCRASTGPCDVAEVCAGLTDSCPPNAFANNSVLCGASSSACTLNTFCAGNSPLCPAPAYAAGGTPCTGVDVCWNGDYCIAGTGNCADGNIPVCCGNSIINALETCDDGNAVSGDGCSATCKREVGWQCNTPGQACTQITCPVAGQVADCTGLCGGLAKVDICGDCYGGSTYRLANASMDLCGICFGFNASLDQCGECNGNNRALDSCGVCHGDNSTCLGCDGVPNSGKEFDLCGICAGKGTSCLGCNGLPIGSGGVNFDRCGVCGGDGSQCVLGCDGSLGSGVLYDCARDCGGSARIDRCGMCSGGSTPFIPDMGYNLACNVCFSICSTACSGVVDVCGICNGGNSSCLGCNLLPIGYGGKVNDRCGVCGGDGTTCVVGCDGVVGSNEVFDCQGNCGGNATVDDCGICAGGTTEVTHNMHMDLCGVCFGANRQRDTCGVCFGNERERDSCGRCFGNNSTMDSCGICYGQNRTKDQCGVCGGGSTTCMGCDNIPNSGVALDMCGVCGGAGVCSAAAAVADAQRNPLSPAATYSIGAGLFFLLILVVAVVAFAGRKWRRGRVYAFESAAEKKEAALAPTGRVAFVVTDIQNSTLLWELLPEEMSSALDMHNVVLRRIMAQCKGYEIKTEGDSFKIAFPSASLAVEWCVRVQQELMMVTWSPALLEQPDCCSERSGKDLIWHGLRVRMGAHFGEAIHFFDKRTMRMDYKGLTMFTTTAVQAVASGGQVIISEAVLAQLGREGFLTNMSSGVTFTPLGIRSLKGVTGALGLHQVGNSTLSKRQFLALKTARSGLTQEDTARGMDTTSQTQRQGHRGPPVRKASSAVTPMFTEFAITERSENGDLAPVVNRVNHKLSLDFTSSEFSLDFSALSTTKTSLAGSRTATEASTPLSASFPSNPASPLAISSIQSPSGGSPRGASTIGALESTYPQNPPAHAPRMVGHRSISSTAAGMARGGGPGATGHMRGASIGQTTASAGAGGGSPATATVTRPAAVRRFSSAGPGSSSPALPTTHAPSLASAASLNASQPSLPASGSPPVARRFSSVEARAPNGLATAFGGGAAGGAKASPTASPATTSTPAAYTPIAAKASPFIASQSFAGATAAAGKKAPGTVQRVNTIQ